MENSDNSKGKKDIVKTFKLEESKMKKAPTGYQKAATANIIVRLNDHAQP